MKVNILFIVLMLFSFSLWGQEKSKKEIEDYPIPKNIEQCFTLLDKTMSDHEKFLIKTLQEDSIYFQKEFQFGADFSDAWKLCDGSRLTKYFNKKGLFDFYGIYNTLLVSYHRYLNSMEIHLASQISNFNNRRQQEEDKYQQKWDSIYAQYQLNKMIVGSINAYIENIHDWMNKGIVIKEQTCHHYICTDGLPNDFSYTSIKNVTFFSTIFFDVYSNPLKRKLKKGISALFVGIELSNNRLCIAILSKNVKITGRKHIGIAISDWGHYFYEYSCEKQEWILAETKYGGV